MAKIKTKAFTAVQQLDGCKPHILTWATAAFAGQVREAVGDAWNTDDRGRAAGWLAAKKNGVRVVPIEITADIR